MSMATASGCSEPRAQEERKLWFDYIKTLNERQLAGSQRSGITTYVLLGTLLGLLYRFGPRLPEFIAQHNKVEVGIVIAALEIMVVSSLWLTAGLLQIYCAGQADFRAVPRAGLAATRVLFALVLLVLAALVFLEVREALAIAHLSKFIEYVCLAYALWLAANLVFPIVRYYRRAKKAKTVKNPPPWFEPFRMPHWAGLMSVPLALAWVALGSICLVIYLKRTPVFWLQPFEASSLTLLFLTILGYMFLRSIGNAGQQNYFGLERDIVLNNIAPAEIRRRYFQDLSGPDMAQWLDEAFVTLDVKEHWLQREQSSAQEKLKRSLISIPNIVQSELNVPLESSRVWTTQSESVSLNTTF